MEELRQINPTLYDQNKIQKETLTQEWINNNYENFNSLRTVITIPVVVQIFGSAANNAITDSRVLEQIAVLNADYRKLNTDASSVPSTFTSVAADCEIEFCLATKDENNNTTTGIVRKTSQQQPATNDSDLWDTDLYLNLLVYDLQGGVLGYTYLASQYPDAGVHIGYDYFGKTGAQYPYNKGRTATHEVGHWLNLEHIWGDANCGNDYVSDTPLHQQDNYGCPSHPKSNSCGTTAEMFMNYMDYTDDACMYMFSAGQKTRMIAAINQYRPGLINNGKCDGGGVAPVASITPFSNSICANTSITYSSNSSGNPSTYSWSFPGGTPSTSTSPSPTITYGVAGTYNVGLTVTNSNGSDTETLTNYLTVNNCSSINENVIKSYKFYPNPTENKLNLEFSTVNDINKIILIDINGKILIEKQLTNSKEVISLENISNGIYHLKLIGNSTVFVEKIEVKK
jgi:PKD repeat protein